MPDTAGTEREPNRLLTLTGVTKRFGALTALNAVSLNIAPGEIHCMLGENGAGKSTLCNVIFGIHPPDEGTMLLNGAPYRPSGPADALRKGIAMVHQHFSLVPDLTVVDNLLLGQARGILDRGACAAQIEKLSAEYGLALAPFAKIQDLSVGERQRVEIIKCLMRNPRLLVLDEPTAVLLPPEIASLIDVCRRVAARGCGVMLVTHKLAEIKSVATRATVLRGGKTVAVSANPADDIGMLVRAMIQRELGPLDNTAEAALGITEPATAGEPTTERPRDIVAQIDGLSLLDPQGVKRLDNVTIEIGRGEIVGIAGVEGNGQSELSAILSGMMRPTSGLFSVQDSDLTGRGPKEITAAGVGVVPEDRHAVGCVTAMSVAENMFLGRLESFSHFGLLRRAAFHEAASAMMQRFDVRASGPGAAFSSLSGGNQQKAVLARELTLPNLAFLVAAQPTRGLDVGAVEAVYGHIREACRRGVGVLLISSELDELLAVADRIVVFYRGRIVGTCPASPAYRERVGIMMSGQPA
ncbi:MAG TPA: ABC transporter ATP-binding protein [Acetobacteraceae bacterium]|jgi:general nucleoside transport system ATP-binding protein|nr:ABC transporter ATP-binding protein [Acetobacteraceae bacterium]